MKFVTGREKHDNDKYVAIPVHGLYFNVIDEQRCQVVEVQAGMKQVFSHRNEIKEIHISYIFTEDEYNTDKCMK
jgi:hypothetical protein